MADNRYKNGKTYRLVNDVDGEFYIGSTCNSLAKRLSMHKRKAKQITTPKVYAHFNKIGWENVKIVLIEEYPCNSKMELERKERQAMESLKPTLNMIIPTRTKQEWVTANPDKMKEKARRYKESNADKVKEADRLKKQKKREENREEYNEKMRNYREANKEVINARRREKHAQKKQVNLA